MQEKKYKIIYADPAWTFSTRSSKGKSKSPEKHYKCMGIDEIKAIPVNDWTEKDAVLLMWTTYTHLPQALEVVKAWGFEYKTVGFVWVKLKKTLNGCLMFPLVNILSIASLFFFGMGFYTRANTEICLLATKGKPLKRESRSVRQLVIDIIREHSRKPDRVRDDIVQLFGDQPRLEMFARTKTEGWDTWGNETEMFK